MATAESLHRPTFPRKCVCSATSASIILDRRVERSYPPPWANGQLGGLDDVPCCLVSARHLHVNLSKDLEEAFAAMAASGRDPESYTYVTDPARVHLLSLPACRCVDLIMLCFARGVSSVEELDTVVSDVATRAFVRTDDDFLERSPHPEAGSTATVTLILGKRCVRDDTPQAHRKR